MPLARGDKEYVLPMKGLNTESNLLHFPQEFTPDVNNMEVDYSPQIVRPRRGVAKTGTITLAETRTIGDQDIAIHSFLWEAVGKDPDKNFIVVQVGRYIYFFDDGDFTAHYKRKDLNDLLSGTVEGTLILAEPTRVDFCNVKGNLLMCSAQIDPVVFRFDGTDIEGTSLVLKQRDMLGVEDGLETDERPTTLSDDHKYNLLNQGWYLARRNTSGSQTTVDPITEFYNNYTGTKYYPSNSDIPFLGMVEEEGDLIFDPEWLRDQTFGSTPAAKGHYTLDVFNLDRAAVISSPSTSGGIFGGSADWDDTWTSIPEYNLP
jgi:hypothetical protein